MNTDQPTSQEAQEHPQTRRHHIRQAYDAMRMVHLHIGEAQTIHAGQAPQNVLVVHLRQAQIGSHRTIRALLAAEMQSKPCSQHEGHYAMPNSSTLRENGPKCCRRSPMNSTKNYMQQMQIELKHRLHVEERRTTMDQKVFLITLTSILLCVMSVMLGTLSLLLVWE